MTTQTTTTKRPLSEHAHVAKLCRQYVKGLGLQVKARSSIFSMGSSVDVKVIDASAEQRKQIEKELNQYQYGHFDGMNDIYENSNSREDIPQVKYVSISFSYSPEIEQAAYDFILKYWGFKDAPKAYEDGKDVKISVHAPTIHEGSGRNMVYDALGGRKDFWNAETEQHETIWDQCEALKPAQPEAKSPAPKAENVEAFDVVEVFHTKKQENIYIVTLPSMERADFNAMRDYVKTIGGWYSRKFGKSPAGFAFEQRAAAECFAASQKPTDPTDPDPKGKKDNNDSDQGESISDQGESISDADYYPLPSEEGATLTDEHTGGNPFETASAPAKPSGNEAKANKLRGIAEKIQKDIDDCFRERLTNTPKRLAQAKHKQLEGEILKRAYLAARKLAALWDSGEITERLKAFTSRKSLMDAVRYKVEPVANGFHTYHVETNEPHERADAAVLMLIAPEVVEVPDTAKELRGLQDGLSFAQIDGFFPTPRPVIEKMAKMLTKQPTREGMRILEPSAGSGNLVNFMRERFPLAKVDCYEINARLRRILELSGHNVIGSDFVNPDENAHQDNYDLIMMNPPFKGMQDVQHVVNAYSLLKSGGELVSVMSAGVTFRKDKADFREWVYEVGGHIQELPDSAFKESGTGVRAVLVYLPKP